jgi:CRP/FNR family transcriptional regulator, cyclic AMP receptor protein
LLQPNFQAPPRRLSLLDVDAELGALLDATHRERARRELQVAVAVLPHGVWESRTLRDASPLNPGLLILDGVVAREIALGGGLSSELLGPGDLIRPWAGIDDVLESETRWNVLAEARVAILDATFLNKAAAFPGIGAMLLERVEARTRRLALTQAIAHMTRVEDRLLAIFRHLAERWGRVTSDGIVVPLCLSHRTLAELIGARRPTVSTAAAKLDRMGALRRRSDGSWLLAVTERPHPHAPASVPQRRRLLAQ